jgi:hypothetical protein
MVIFFLVDVNLLYQKVLKTKNPEILPMVTQFKVLSKVNPPNVFVVG